MEDFAAKLTDILNKGALNLALAIGYKNRVFDTLEGLDKPVTILELAAASGLDARYLKEWLGIMVTGRILDLGMMWGQAQAEALLREAGFKYVEPTEMDYDPFNLHYLCRVSE